MSIPFSSLFPASERTVGVWVSSSSCVIAEMCAAAGFDFLIIDNEHAGWGGDNNISLVRAGDSKNIPSIIRVTDIAETPIKQALDLGATGVMIPGVKSVEDAKNAVAYTKFGANGKRGACPYTRANDYAVNRLMGYYDDANENLSAPILLIEGMEAVNNIDEILSIPGLHSIAVGPVDLSVELGIPGDVTNPLIENIIRDIIAKCKKHNVYYLAQCTSREEAEKWFGWGADYAMMSDIMMFADISKKMLHEVKGD